MKPRGAFSRDAKLCPMPSGRARTSRPRIVCRAAAHRRGRGFHGSSCAGAGPRALPAALAARHRRRTERGELPDFDGFQPQPSFARSARFGSLGGNEGRGSAGCPDASPAPAECARLNSLARTWRRHVALAAVRSRETGEPPAVKPRSGPRPWSPLVPGRALDGAVAVSRRYSHKFQ